jgi:hypothetical protein
MAIIVHQTSIMRLIRVRSQFSARASSYSEVSIESSRSTRLEAFGDIGHHRTSGSEHLICEGELTAPPFPPGYFPNHPEELPGLLPGEKVFESLDSTHDSVWERSLRTTASFERAIDQKNPDHNSGDDSASCIPALCTLHSTLCTLHSALCTLHPAPCTLHLERHV